MTVVYRGKKFEIVDVIGTHDAYYLIARLTKDNELTFTSVAKLLTPRNEFLFKEDCEGCKGMVPIDIFDKKKNLGRFRLDAWMDESFWEAYEEERNG